MLEFMIWKPVPVIGLEKTHEISDTGLVKRIIQGRTKKPGILPGCILTSGYRQAYLQNKPAGVKRKFMVHRLVMAAFVGPCPDGMEVNHKDGDKLNNNLDNLEYVTRLENIHHSHRIGRGRRGECHGMSIFNNQQVIEIRERFKNGEFMRALARHYKCSRGCIKHIVIRKSWKHI